MQSTFLFFGIQQGIGSLCVNRCRWSQSDISEPKIAAGSVVQTSYLGRLTKLSKLSTPQIKLLLPVMKVSDSKALTFVIPTIKIFRFSYFVSYV